MYLVTMQAMHTPHRVCHSRRHQILLDFQLELPAFSWFDLEQGQPLLNNLSSNIAKYYSHGCEVIPTCGIDSWE